MTAKCFLTTVLIQNFAGGGKPSSRDGTALSSRFYIPTGIAASDSSNF